MDRTCSSDASAPHDSNMYDEQLYSDERHRSSPAHGYENFWKDNQRTPPRGPAGDRIHSSANPERRQRDGRYTDDFEHSRPPRREGRGRYTDRDREGYQSPPDRSRSCSPYFGGPPSRTVILEGLSADLTQEDILKELQQSLRVGGIEEVRLIRDKRTGQSRQFAFAQFVGIPEARRFLNRYYPTVSLYGSYNPGQTTGFEPAKVRIAYSREKEDREKPGKGEDDWKCDVCYLANYTYRTLCFRCNAPRTRATAHGVFVSQTNMSSVSGFATTGDSDASLDGTASQFLLFRALEPGVNEELLVKGASKLCKTKTSNPSANAHTSKKKIASTSADASLGAKEGSLRRVLLIRDRKSNDSWRYGFAEFNTIEDAQNAMARYKASDRWTISSKPVLVSYIHAGVFVPVLHTLDPELARFTFSPLANNSVQLMYWDEGAYASELATAVLPRPSNVKNMDSEHAKLAAAAAREGLVASGKDGEPKAKKRKLENHASNANKQVVAPHLQFWSNKHAELHGIQPKDETTPPADSASAIQDKSLALTPDAPPKHIFADLERKCCLLCSRQFKTDAEVNKHERMSLLHQDNLKNEDLVAKALQKLTRSLDPGSDGADYRDRAKERRQTFNQPKQPTAQYKRSTQDGRVPKENVEPTPVPSKGAALLSKMGWTVGEGLGAQGTGRTDIITPELYIQGVGLGAQGNKPNNSIRET